MAERSQRSFFMTLSILIMGVVGLLVFTYAIVGDNGYLELRRREEENLELNRKIEQLRQENKAILQEIKALKTDPKAIEKIAREELGMVKPGEVKITTNPAGERKPPIASEPGQPHP
jgi:cell division protein FtsB